MMKVNELDKQRLTMLTSRTEWTHAISVNQLDPTVGSIWQLHYEGAQRLQKKDSTLEYFFIVAQSPVEKAHGHGVLKTSLTHREIQSCFRGGNKPVVKNLYDTDRWVDYCIKQALQQTELYQINNGE